MTLALIDQDGTFCLGFGEDPPSAFLEARRHWLWTKGNVAPARWLILWGEDSAEGTVSDDRETAEAIVDAFVAIETQRLNETLN